MITDTELERLERLAEGATEGEWDSSGTTVSVRWRGAVAQCPVPKNGGTFECVANAAYIAELHPAKALALISSVRALRARAEAAEAENERLRKALEPFARVAEHDIGDDEDDTDTFWPMSNARYSMSGRLRVGHLRAARLALENTNGSR